MSQVQMLRIDQMRRQCDDDVSIKLHVRGKIFIKNNNSTIPPQSKGYLPVKGDTMNKQSLGVRLRRPRTGMRSRAHPGCS